MITSVDSFVGYGITYITNGWIDLSILVELDFTCKTLFTVFILMEQLAAFTLLLFSVERLVVVYFPLRAKTLLSYRHTWITTAVVLGIVVLLSLHLPVSIHSVQFRLSTYCTVDQVRTPRALSALFWMAMGLESFAFPTVAISVLNIFILRRVLSASLKRHHMVLLQNLWFIRILNICLMQCCCCSLNAGHESPLNVDQLYKRGLLEGRLWLEPRAEGHVVARVCVFVPHRYEHPSDAHLRVSRSELLGSVRDLLGDRERDVGRGGVDRVSHHFILEGALNYSVKGFVIGCGNLSPASLCYRWSIFWSSTSKSPIFIERSITFSLAFVPPTICRLQRVQVKLNWRQPTFEVSSWATMMFQKIHTCLIYVTNNYSSDFYKLPRNYEYTLCNKL